MPTPTGRPLDDPTLRGRLDRIEANAEQIKREILKPVKAAPVVAGGGPLGIAHVHALPSSVKCSGIDSGSELRNDFDYRFVTYPAPPAGSLDPVTWCTPRSYAVIDLAAGWYDVSIFVEMAWAAASAPTSLRPLTYGGGGGQSPPSAPFSDPQVIPATTTQDGTMRGISQHLHPGILDFAAPGQLSFEMRLVGATFTGDFLPVSGYENDNPAVWWTITKLA